MVEKPYFRKVMGEILMSESKTAIVLSVDETPRKFSELQKKLDLKSGNLNYHLLTLQNSGLLIKDIENRYAITSKGHSVAKTLREIFKTSRETGS